MILHAPEASVPARDDGRLDAADGVRGEHLAAGRQGGDLVLVAAERVEGGQLVAKHRVTSPRLGRVDAPGDSDLPAAWIEAHLAAQRRRHQLQSPARTEGGDARLPDLPHQRDLLPHRGLVQGVGIERRSRDPDPVEVADPQSLRKRFAVGDAQRKVLERAARRAVRRERLLDQRVIGLRAALDEPGFERLWRRVEDENARHSSRIALRRGARGNVSQADAPGRPLPPGKADRVSVRQAGTMSAPSGDVLATSRDRQASNADPSRRGHQTGSSAARRIHRGC